MALLKDPDAMNKGIVQVVYNFGERHATTEKLQMVQRFTQAVPHRTVAIHFCYASAKVLMAVTGLQLLFSDSRKFRLRKHGGNLDNIHFELQTFGIPVEESPMQRDGTWSTKGQMEWIELQEQRERAVALRDSGAITSKGGLSPIMAPRPFDVLFGKDKTALSHPGNLRCLHVVEMLYDEYEKAGRREKTQVADSVLKIVEESKGRFLKRSKFGWEQVEHSVAREKISHFFRSLREKRSSATNDSNSGSSNSAAKKRTSDTSATFTSSVASLSSSASLSSESRVVKRVAQK